MQVNEAPTPSPQTSPPPKPSAGNPRLDLFNGVLLLAAAAFLWWYFTDFENSTDTSRRMNATLAMLYNAGGKWLPVGLFAATGTWLSAKGGLGLAKRQ